MTSNPPRITVIIPTYNYSAALRCALRSVLQQTEQDFELIVVGDGCTGGSAEVVASFGDARLRFHNLPENSGSQAAPNNAGMSLARGRLIAWLGHDDVWLPRHLERLAAWLEDSGAAWAHSVCVWIGPPEFPYLSAHGLHARDLAQIKPAQLMIRREAAAKVSWPLMRELPPSDSTEVEFMRRLEAATGPGATLKQITALKLPASHRRGSYAAGTAAEQESLLERMAAEPDFTERLLAGVIHAYAEGRQHHPQVSGLGGKTPGHNVEMLRRLRGLPPQPGFGNTEPELLAPAWLAPVSPREAALQAQVEAMQATRAWRWASAWWSFRDKWLRR